LGIVWANTYYDMKSYHIRLETEGGASISGLETIFYKDDIYKEGIFFITDPDRKYIPNIAIPPVSNIVSSKKLSENLSSSGWDWHDVTMYLKSKFDNGKNLVVKKIEEGLPSWDYDKMCEHPGFVYLGDWSFSQLEQLNTNLSYANAIVSFAVPNPVTPEVAGILAATGEFFENIDFFIDQVNFLFPSLDLDKDKKYSIYQPPMGGPSGMVFSLTSYNYCKKEEEDIKYLLPTKIGNSWTFKSGWHTYTAEIERTKRINGKDLLVSKSTSGIKEYIGFLGDALYYYGIGDSSVGDILFDPPLKLGDNRVGVGKTYHPSSRIIAKNYPVLLVQLKSL